MGLYHGPFIRGPVCILWTPIKMAAGNQPLANRRKAAVGTAGSPSLTQWEGPAVGGTVCLCLPVVVVDWATLDFHCLDSDQVNSPNDV